MQDDLFTPTIRERPASGRPPWRPDSIMYPAFFGGPLAATALGLMNGRRLGLTAGPLTVIALAGAAAFAARLAITAAFDGRSGIRFIGAVAGVLVWLVVLGFQRRPFRAFTLGDREPASLIGPGFAALLVGALVEAAAVATVLE